MEALLHIGPKAADDGIEPLADAIIRVMSVPHADQKTIRAGLALLEKATKAPATMTISGCSFTGDQVSHHYPEAPSDGDDYEEEDDKDDEDETI